VVVLDSSGSIVRSDFERATAFVADLVNVMDVEGDRARIAFLVFSTTSTVKFYLDKYSTRREMIADISK